MLAILLLERYCMRASRGFVNLSWMVLLASLPERKVSEYRSLAKKGPLTKERQPLLLAQFLV